MPQLVLLKVTEKGGVLTLARLQDLLVIEALLMEWSPPISCATVGR